MNEEIEELLITLVRQEPVVYDKKLEDYKRRGVKEEKFEIMSQVIFQIYGEHYSGNDSFLQSIVCFSIVYIFENYFLFYLRVVESLMKKWDQLRDKFVEEHKKVMGYIPSGSGGKENVNISNWPLYNSLQFLMESIEHAPMMSSIERNKEKKMKPRAVITLRKKHLKHKKRS